MKNEELYPQMSKFKVGDRVRLLVEVEPYYSGYAGSPKVVIPAGQEGTVEAVDVPCVRQTRKGFSYFICVDFELQGRNWRCSVYKDQIEKIS